MMTNALIPTYNPLPVAMTHGEGVYLWDTEGNRYLDAVSGIAVTGLGHAHPAVTAVIQEQAGKLLHTANTVQIPAQIKLAEQLCQLTGLAQAFFANSGAEAVECAIKLARLKGHKQGFEHPQIIVAEHAFHGRTLATLTASGSRKVQAGFEPLVQGFIRVPYNDVDSLETIAAHQREVAAILLEPIQGEGGIQVPKRDYLRQVKSIADKHGWLLMLDEVQTGMGRTGSLFHFQQHGFVPDVLTSAKGLANGLPMGACLIQGKAMDVMGAAQHGSTFGGNPLCSRVASTVLDVITKENLAQNAEKMGTLLKTKLQEALQGCPIVKEIRGQGLMLGIELTIPCRPLLFEGLKAGLLFNVTGENRVVRLLPPLILQEEHVHFIVEKLSQIIIQAQAG